MKLSKSIVFINQSINDLFVDVVNEFDSKYPELILMTGCKHPEELRKLKSGVRVEKITAYNRTSTFMRLFTWLFASIQILIKIKLKYRDSDLFIVSNPPMAFGIPLFCKNKYSLLVYDVYPDVLYRSNIIKETNPLCRWWKSKNRLIYSRAENIYTIGSSMAKCISQYIDSSRIMVIPNWADTNFLKPIEKNENSFVIEHGLLDKFIVLYSGNIGNTHNVEALVEVAGLLKQETDIIFIIIGEGAKRQYVENLVNEKRLRNCILLPFQPVEKLPFSLGSADMGVITLDVNASQLSVPSKTYSMMAAGAALLCLAGKNSELAALVEQYKVGKLFEPACVSDMADYILDLQRHPEKLLQYRNNARKASFNFTPVNARKYVDSYKMK